MKTDVNTEKERLSFNGEKSDRRNNITKYIKPISLHENISKK